MAVILLCMKKRGIRFLSKMKFEQIESVKFGKKDKFFSLLRSRPNEYDNVMIMAHGSKKCILTTTHDLNIPYEKYIDLDETKVFVNNFIFAISCETALEFGEECIKNGAITYVGYIIQIGQLFTTSSKNIPTRISDTFDTIIKRIFVEELSKSYEQFIQKMISAEVLKQLFSFLVEKRLCSLLDSSPKDIFLEYGLRISDVDYGKYAAAIIMKILSFFDEMSRHLIIIGERNYFSDNCINRMIENGDSRDDILRKVESNIHYQRLLNQSYKIHILEKATNAK